MVNIAVVEDDKNYSSLLCSFIERYKSENKMDINLAVFSSGVNFLFEQKSQFDVVFLDIEMPHLNGIETARKLRLADETVVLIFVTNMAQYAINGYEVSAMDFMVKPVSYINLCTKLNRAIKMRDKLRGTEILLKTESGFIKATPKDIYYIEVFDHYLTYYTTKGIFRERETIKKREEQLKSSHFEKCNNCYLVNLRHVTEFDNLFVTVNNTKLGISRAKRKDFINALTKFMGEFKI